MASQQADAKTPLVYFDGRVVPWNEARIHVFAPVVKYGAGVFEGIRGYWNEEHGQMYLFRLQEHLDRLRYSQIALRIDPVIGADEVREALLQLLRANGFRETVHIRAMVYVDGDGESNARGPSALTITALPRPLPQRVHDGVQAQVSSWRRVADQAMPMRAKANANYNNARLAGIQSAADGYGAAILLNDRGKVAEGPGMCIFLVRDGVVITPDVTSDILESITRDCVITVIGEDLGLRCVQRTVDRSELLAAEEAFFCGTGWEITPITHIDRVALGDGAPGAITRRLQSVYFDLVHGRNRARTRWRTPVYAA